jgi:hypothetical protein
MTDILCQNANISVLLLVRELFYVVRLLYDINIYVDRYRVTSPKRFAKFRSVAKRSSGPSVDFLCKTEQQVH